MQRKDLETHLQSETRHHLDLACRKLKDSQDEVTKKITKLEKQLQEKASVNIFQNQLEDRVNVLQNQLEDRVNVLQNQLEDRENLLQNQLAGRVDTLQTEIYEKVDSNHKRVEKELNTYRNLFFCFVVVAVVGVFLYQTNIIQNQHERLVILEGKVESRFQKPLEGKAVVRQTQLEKKIEKLHYNLESKISDVQSTMENKVDNFQKEIDSLNTELRNIIQNQQERLVIPEEKVKSYQKTLEEKVVVVQSQLEEKVEKVNDVQSKMEKKVDNVKKDMDSLDTKLSYKIMLLNTAEPHTFTWKIKHFENILTQAKKRSHIYKDSEPFHIYGYKLKLRLIPNGYEKGEKTHLSLFIGVIKGEHDAILAWPFHKRVEFTLIDQQENPDNRKNITMAFLAQPHLGTDSARPVKDENFGWGFLTFVSHDKLKERRYIVDDTIFIQVKLSPPR